MISELKDFLLNTDWFKEPTEIPSQNKILQSMNEGCFHFCCLLMVMMLRNANYPSYGYWFTS